MNTSQTPGYLTPTSGPLTEEELQDVLTAMVAGITGLPGKMVRPRWQPKPPKQPEHNIPWCAVGIPDEDHDRFSAVIHEGGGDDGQGGEEGGHAVSPKVAPAGAAPRRARPG